MARTCKRCLKEYKEPLKKNFYSRGKDANGTPRIDSVCKYCRREESKKLFAAHKEKYRSPGYRELRRKNLAAIKRDTKEGFVRYMTLNPFYFTEVFGKEASESNILEEYYRLSM